MPVVDIVAAIGTCAALYIVMHSCCEVLVPGREEVRHADMQETGCLAGDEAAKLDQ